MRTIFVICLRGLVHSFLLFEVNEEFLMVYFSSLGGGEGLYIYIYASTYPDLFLFFVVIVKRFY